MSQMIPLKIADMAVESCNKEIARLLFEKAELQGRVIALEAQLESEKAAYKALRSSSFVTAVSVEEYEKLKAEVERLKGIILAQSSDFVRSKTADDGIKPEGHNDLAGRAVEHCLKLQAEVERLTDTLNKLVKTPPEATGGVRVKVDFWTQYGSRLPSSYETFWENAAKEGKQS